MVLPLWGALEKAQDNDQTINEAITAAILAHNEAAQAHLEALASLSAHKTEDVIDHPAGSVLYDKMSAIELWRDFLMVEGEGWSSVGTVGFDDQPGISLSAIEGDIVYSKTDLLAYLGTRYVLEIDADLTFQAVVVYDGDTANIVSHFGFLQNTQTPTQMLGFKIDGGYVYPYIKTSTNTTTGDAITVDLSVLHVYRFLYTQGEVKFYIDGTLEQTLSMPAGSFTNAYDIDFRIDGAGFGSGEECYMWVQDAKYATVI